MKIEDSETPQTPECRTPHLVDNDKEERLINQGLHLDWLVRANLVNTLETLIYLSQQREKWVHEDQKIILTILQKYEQSEKGLIAENEPHQSITKRRGSLSEKFSSACGDPQEVVLFTRRFLELVKAEPVIWDKVNSPEFGYHQPMRQAWCSISLKLGGWGTMQHVHMLKQFYRRKRDQYNIDHLRLGRPFLYSKDLCFLKNLLEMTNIGAIPDGIISIEEHVKASAPEIVYDDEILEAPVEIQQVLTEVSELIDKVGSMYPPEALADFLSMCCNDVVQNREHLAVNGLQDHEWINQRPSLPDGSQSD